MSRRAAASPARVATGGLGRARPAQAFTDRLLTYLPHGSLRRRMATGAFWSVLGSGVSQLSMLLTAVLTARVLGASVFGALGMVLLTVSLGAALATFGLDVTATKYVASERDLHPERAGRFVGSVMVMASALGAVCALALALLAPRLARDVLAAPQLAGGLRLGGLLMALQAVNAVQSGALSGLEAFASLAVGSVTRGLGTLALASAGARLGGLTGALVGYAVGAAVSVLAHAGLALRACHRRGLRVTFRPGVEEWAALRRFSLPVLVANLAFTPASWWSGALLVRHSTYSENGVFNAARNWQNAVLFFSNAVATLGLPVLANLTAARDFRRYARGLLANFGLTGGLATLAALPIAALAPWIMRLYGPDFASRGLVLVWVSLSAVLMAVNITAGHVIWSLDAVRTGVVLGVTRGLALVGFSYLFVPRGADGIALAWVATGLFQTVTHVPAIAWVLRRRRAEWRAAARA